MSTPETKWLQFVNFVALSLSFSPSPCITCIHIADELHLDQKKKEKKKKRMQTQSQSDHYFIWLWWLDCNVSKTIALWMYCHLMSPSVIKVMINVHCRPCRSMIIERHNASSGKNQFTAFSFLSVLCPHIHTRIHTKVDASAPCFLCFCA